MGLGTVAALGPRGEVALGRPPVVRPWPVGGSRGLPKAFGRLASRARCGTALEFGAVGSRGVVSPVGPVVAEDSPPSGSRASPSRGLILYRARSPSLFLTAADHHPPPGRAFARLRCPNLTLPRGGPSPWPPRPWTASPRRRASVEGSVGLCVAGAVRRGGGWPVARVCKKEGFSGAARDRGGGRGPAPARRAGGGGGLCRRRSRSFQVPRDRPCARRPLAVRSRACPGRWFVV